jgi:nicotinate dehydrogenase subunit B
MSELPPSLAKHPELDTWVRIDDTETVTVFSGKSEHGQGLRSMLARIGAEELDVALERVRVETADTAHGLDEGLTAGSMSTQESGAALRQAAAEARARLLELAAAELGADPGELRVDDGTISGGGRATTYWRLLGGRTFGVRASGRARPKQSSEHRIVGGAGRRVDLTGIVTGTTRYLQDLSLPEMLHGRVVRPPSRTARLDDADDAHTRSLPGVVAVVRDGSFLGVVAEREEQALAGAAALASSARWSEEASLRPLASVTGWLRSQPGRAFRVVDGVGVEGDVPPVAEPAEAARTVRATYTRPFTLHGSIGPSAAVARWHDGGLEVWSSTQGVFPLRRALAEALRVEPETVRVRHVEAAGCYGHNGADDAALDAALLARATRRPVRVVLTREQEHTWEPYGPATSIDMQASLDAQGRLLDWNHDVWSNSHIGRAAVAPPGTSALASAWLLSDPLPPPVSQPRLMYHGGIHRNADPLYAVPSRRVVKHFVEGGPVRVSSLRSLGAFANVFAIESFMDEVAEAAGSDPLVFRLAYLEDERAREVLETASREIGPPRRGGFGRGVGVAFAQYKNMQCYAAVAVELHVDDETATVQLDRVVVAADAGEVIDPSGLANQLEGGVVQAASWTLKEQVTFDDTHITSSAWDTYPIITFPEVPAVEVVLLDRPGVTPVGAGEATQGPTAAAIANAVYDAIGVRVRDLPVTPDRIRAAAAL